jgi:hypothetical protein
MVEHFVFKNALTRDYPYDKTYMPGEFYTCFVERKPQYRGKRSTFAKNTKRNPGCFYAILGSGVIIFC